MIEKIDLEWLKSFITFAESSGVDETAKKLKITQPAVTQHLMKLEAQLPHKLFMKDGKKKILTQFGQEFYRSTSLHLRGLDDILRNTKQLSGKLSDITYRIGVNTEIFYRVCDKIKFEGQLEITPIQSQHTIDDVSKRKIDIAVSRLIPSTSADIIALKWFTDSFVLSYPKKWHQEIQKHGLQYLQQKKYILYAGLEEQSPIFLNTLDLESEKIKPGYLLTDWFSAIKLIEKGLGWGFIPNSFDLPKEIEITDLPNKVQVKSQFYLLYHRSIRNHPGFQDLLKDLVVAMTK